MSSVVSPVSVSLPPKPCSVVFVLVVVSWAKLDTAAGESAIQIDVAWDIENYTDATARQYLIDTYHWAIHGGSFDGRKTIKGNNAANILTTTSTKTTLHGLGGNDTLTGDTTDDILVGRYPKQHQSG
jgi:Ca2+-binding RTX toxin-like protein